MAKNNIFSIPGVRLSLFTLIFSMIIFLSGLIIQAQNYYIIAQANSLHFDQRQLDQVSKIVANIMLGSTLNEKKQSLRGRSILSTSISELNNVIENKRVFITHPKLQKIIKKIANRANRIINSKTYWVGFKHKTIKDKHLLISLLSLGDRYLVAKTIVDYEIKDISSMLTKRREWSKKTTYYLLIIAFTLIIGIMFFMVKTINIFRKNKEELERKSVELKLHTDGLENIIQERTQEIMAVRDEAIKANKIKSLFLANISHEIRTPMHGVLSFANIGIKKYATASPEEILDYFEEIKKTGTRLLSLLNNILDLSKLEAGKESYNFSNINTNQLIQACISQFNATIEERSLTISYKPIEQEIEADKDKLLQVMTNLISNAIKFADPKSNIKISSDITDSLFFNFSVQNRGKTLPVEDLGIIFDKFKQSDTNNKKSGGTGLGLSICREIIHDHSGKIWATSNENITKFIFCIPIKQKQVEAA